VSGSPCISPSCCTLSALERAVNPGGTSPVPYGLILQRGVQRVHPGSARSQNPRLRGMVRGVVTSREGPAGNVREENGSLQGLSGAFSRACFA
jgi:hypothetical protein